MKIVWVFLCLTPFTCMQGEKISDNHSIHSLHRRDVSHLLKTHPNSYNDPKNGALFHDNSRQLNQITGDHLQEHLKPDPSRAYLPPVQQTGQKSIYPSPVHHSDHYDHQIPSSDSTQVTYSGLNSGESTNPPHLFPGNTVNPILKELQTPREFIYSPSSHYPRNIPNAYDELHTIGQNDIIQQRYLRNQNTFANVYTSQPNVRYHTYKNDNSKLSSVHYTDPAVINYNAKSTTPYGRDPQTGASRYASTDLSSEGHFSSEQQTSSANPGNYEFKYSVGNTLPAPEFGHEEKRTGGVTSGHYYVLLPDGRRQTVKYVADDAGFRPEISFEGKSLNIDYRDPLSTQNVNAVVADLLNNDIHRSRDQKAYGFSEYPNQFIDAAAEQPQTYGGKKYGAKSLPAHAGNDQSINTDGKSAIYNNDQHFVSHPHYTIPNSYKTYPSHQSNPNPSINLDLKNHYDHSHSTTSYSSAVTPNPPKYSPSLPHPQNIPHGHELSPNPAEQTPYSYDKPNHQINSHDHHLSHPNYHH